EHRNDPLSHIVMAGLVPAIPLMLAPSCFPNRDSRVFGLCPAMTSQRGISHPEDSELGLSDRRIEARRNGERQQAAGVERVDDAVVPKARAGVIRMALGFVLGADR